MKTAANKIYGINASRHLNLEGYTEQTTFMNDFAIAEQFGIEAVKDTFKRAFDEWKDDIKYLAELCLVTNTLCWHFYSKGNEKLSGLYADYYHQCMDYAYTDGNFNEEDTQYFFRTTD